MSRPILRLLGHLEDVSKKDAREYLDALVARHFEDYPDESVYFDLLKWRDGWLYELTVGGDGRSRLKSLSKHLDESEPGTRLYLPTAERALEVQLSKDGRFTSRLMPESFVIPGEAHEPKAGKKSEKLRPSRAGFLVFGVAMISLSLVLFAAALTLSKVAELEYERIALINLFSLTDYDDLPISHRPDVNLGPHDYVSKIEFRNGQWQEPVIKSVMEKEIESAAGDVMDDQGIEIPETGEVMP